MVGNAATVDEAPGSEPDPGGAKVLYLSYDGMCDPLGASQVLPYLFGLAGRGHRISLISFEKPERSAEERAAVARACAEHNIAWHPLRYHKRPPVLSAMYDVRQMRRLSERLNRQEPFDLVHCRSYLPALVGLAMKRSAGIPFLFDMRGFWADERVDGRIWNLANPLFRIVYAFFKKRELEFLDEADQIVSLTVAGKEFLLSRRPADDAGPPITIIPCCVDFSLFTPVTPKIRASARRLLAIDDAARVAVYLGSFGGWILVDEMLAFFRVQLERDPHAVFLIISKEPRRDIIAAAAKNGVPEGRLIVRAASRAEVPKLAAAADYALFFVAPTFSKKASSPVKMGEFLALELPIVTNGNVGDVEQIVEEAGCGIVVDRFDHRSYDTALDNLERLKPDKSRWRAAARRWFDLGTAIDRYDAIYRKLKRDFRGT